MDKVMNIVSNLTYVAQAWLAVVGAYYCVVVWRRVLQKRFKNEQQQDEFLDELAQPLAKGDFEGAMTLCEGDIRAIPQLGLLGMLNRQLGFTKVRDLIEDRFQRDILADLEHRMTWIHLVIKTAPMVGLFGTVTGMMAAFGKLATMENVQADQLASDISFALITTAVGLATALPLMVAVAALNIRIRKMEELTIAGLNHMVEMLQHAMSRVALSRR